MENPSRGKVAIEEQVTFQASGGMRDGESTFFICMKGEDNERESAHLSFFASFFFNGIESEQIFARSKLVILYQENRSAPMRNIV